MRRVPHITVFVAAIGLLVAIRLPVARASPPMPQSSTVPPMLLVVGTDGAGHPDPAGAFTVVARRLSGIPVAGASVDLSFSDCPDLKICTDQRASNVYVDCVNKIVRGIADMNGSVTFYVLGCARNFGGSPGALDSTLKVFANGVLLRTVRVAILDQVGCDGVDTGDLSAWLTDFFSGQPYARSDYSGDGVVDTGDLALWLDRFFAAGSVLGGGATCP